MLFCAQPGCTNQGPTYLSIGRAALALLPTATQEFMRSQARCLPCFEAVDGRRYRLGWDVIELRGRSPKATNPWPWDSFETTPERWAANAG